MHFEMYSTSASVIVGWRDKRIQPGFSEKSDWFIFDAKAATGAQPGGTGHQFDWAILSHYQGRTPWMLAGGLTIDTVAEALTTTGASAVDVSSGVEHQSGKKDENKIHDFIQAAQIG